MGGPGPRGGTPARATSAHWLDPACQSDSRAAADHEQRVSGAEPAEELVADPHVVLLLPAIALEPEKRVVELHSGQGVRQRGVDVDPDEETRVLSEHLHGRGAAQR